MTKLHYRDVRLYSNAGFSFPTCGSGAIYLDTSKSSIPTTPDKTKVTCKHCLRKLNKRGW